MFCKKISNIIYYRSIVSKKIYYIIYSPAANIVVFLKIYFNMV